MIIKAIWSSAFVTMSTHCFCRVIVDLTAVYVVVKAPFPFAFAPKCTNVQLSIDFPAVLVQVWAVPLLATPAKLARLRRLHRPLAELFTHSRPLLDNIFRNGAKARRQPMRDTIIIVGCVVESHRLRRRLNDTPHFRRHDHGRRWSGRGCCCEWLRLPHRLLLCNSCGSTST
jgi:hypothetical protein